MSRAVPDRLRDILDAIDRCRAYQESCPQPGVEARRFRAGDRLQQRVEQPHRVSGDSVG